MCFASRDMREYHKMARRLVEQMINEGYAVGEIKYVIPQMEAYLDRLITNTKLLPVKKNKENSITREVINNGKETGRF
ncbi:MAG: hypothetical protein IJB67_01880 [Firmicutes bacterium]|nr:hypothetical protein [Bacillota bacterium]